MIRRTGLGVGARALVGMVLVEGVVGQEQGGNAAANPYAEGSLAAVAADAQATPQRYNPTLRIPLRLPAAKAVAANLSSEASAYPSGTPAYPTGNPRAPTINTNGDLLGKMSVGEKVIILVASVLLLLVLVLLVMFLVRRFKPKPPIVEKEETFEDRATALPFSVVQMRRRSYRSALGGH